MEEGGTVEEVDEAVWAAAMGDRQEHAIKVGMISRKIIIRYRPTPNQSGSDPVSVATQLFRYIGSHRPNVLKKKRALLSFPTMLF